MKNCKEPNLVWRIKCCRWSNKAGSFDLLTCTCSQMPSGYVVFALWASRPNHRKMSGALLSVVSNNSPSSLYKIKRQPIAHSLTYPPALQTMAPCNLAFTAPLIDCSEMPAPGAAPSSKSLLSVRKLLQAKSIKGASTIKRPCYTTLCQTEP